jgi:hypothetical protein
MLYHPNMSSTTFWTTIVLKLVYRRGQTGASSDITYDETQTTYAYLVHRLPSALLPVSKANSTPRSLF